MKRSNIFHGDSIQNHHIIYRKEKQKKLNEYKYSFDFLQISFSAFLNPEMKSTTFILVVLVILCCISFDYVQSTTTIPSTGSTTAATTPYLKNILFVESLISFVPF